MMMRCRIKKKTKIIDFATRWRIVAGVYCWIIVATVFASEFDEFDVNTDLKIDAPVVTPMPTGFEHMLHLGINGPMKSSPDTSSGAGGAAHSGSMPPQAENIRSDLSGWGPIGKMHPNVVLKDKLVRAYHNRLPDPRYTHLQGYGHLARHPHHHHHHPKLAHLGVASAAKRKLGFLR